MEKTFKKTGVIPGKIITVKKGEILMGDLIHWSASASTEADVIQRLEYQNGSITINTPNIWSYLPKGTIVNRSYVGFLSNYESDIHPIYGEESP